MSGLDEVDNRDSHSV